MPGTFAGAREETREGAMLAVSQGLHFFLQGAPRGLGQLYSCWLSPPAAPQRCLPLLIPLTHRRLALHTMGATEEARTPSSLRPRTCTLPRERTSPSSAFRPAQLYGLLFQKPSLPALPTSAALTRFSPGPLSWPCLTGTAPCSLQAESSRPPPVPPASAPRTTGWGQRLSRAPGVPAGTHLHTALLQLLCALQE